MSARIGQLEALLGRVQERAAQPRPIRAAAAPAAQAEALDEVELDEPVFDEPELDEPEMMEPELDEVELDEPEMMEPELDEVEFDEVDLDEPESGQVSSGSMDQALSDAEHQPPMTPPPESGEGIASPQMPKDEGPTMEQLGETIQLEEGGSQDFELDEPVLDEPSLDAPELDEPELLEAEISESLPPAPEELSVPENAREELERVRLGDATPVQARVSVRPVLSTNVVELIDKSRGFEPKSFLELLDASLSLK